jgi:hypothetical protein
MDSSVWRRPEDEPEDKQLCNIAGRHGLSCTMIVCNIPYFRDTKVWMDLFATMEAGEAYGADVVVAWMPAELIPPVPADFFKTRTQGTQEQELSLSENESCPLSAQPTQSRWRTWLKKVLHR